MAALSKEEYIEQEFFFRTFSERLQDGYSTQEILYGMKSELLSATNLPMAVGVLFTEVKHSGKMNLAMKRMQHYFTPFQTFIVHEAEKEDGRFDFRIALQLLESEAKYRAGTPTPQGIFFFQFESVCRNRLGYDHSLEAIANDPIFDDDWRYWINVVLRRQIGFIDLPKLIYVRSAFYQLQDDEEPQPILFSERAGRIAHASAGRDPLFFFSALSRHIGYPAVPRQHHKQEREDPAIAELRRKIEQLEDRVQLLREELKGGINLDRFYVKK
ncbi:MAG: hypothetical protein ACOX0A_03220 [Thermoguttaceae bacterium]